MNMKDRLLQRLRRFLLNNKGAKLLALLLAVITWYAIQPSISFETIVSDVPVRVTVDSGWAVLEQSPGSAEVHFRGSREGIRDLPLQQLEVAVDMRGEAYEETITVPLELSDVNAPPAVRPFHIRPSELVLSVDQERGREVPVRPLIQGSPPEGYEVESVTTEPPTVTVSGPRQRLETIEAIRTVPIDMEGRLQSFNVRVDLVSPSRTWTARMDPERVEVQVVLTERAATATFEDLRIRTMTDAARQPAMDVTPTHVTVELVGRAELLNELTPRDIRVYVDLTEIRPEDASQELPVRVHVPARVRVDRLEPATVTIRTNEQPSASSVPEESGEGA